MSEKTIQQRAAEVRQGWSRNERQQRAVMGKRRCVELMWQVGLVKNSTSKWRVPVSA